MLTVLAAPEDALLHALAPSLEKAFSADVAMAAATPLPKDAYNPSRGQYLSTRLLDAVAQRKQPQWERLLGIADVDLYVPDLNFVFGEADQKRGVAVFSLVRLHTPDRDRFVRRAATEAIHELAHTYGLSHCDNPQCVMWFSNTLEETDRKGTSFCPAHARALERAITNSARA